MAEEQAASDTPGMLEPVQAQSPANPVRRLTLIVIAIGAALFLHGIAADRLTPYTAQALVQAVNRRARRAVTRSRCRLVRRITLARSVGHGADRDLPSHTSYPYGKERLARLKQSFVARLLAGGSWVG